MYFSTVQKELKTWVDNKIALLKIILEYLIKLIKYCNSKISLKREVVSISFETKIQPVLVIG